VTVAGNSSTNAPGHTALMAAAETGNRDLVESLLKAGANPNARDKNGITPLKFAQNSPEIINLLKAAGARQ